MKNQFRYSCVLVMLLSLSITQSTYAINKVGAAIIGAGAMAAVILAIEHGVIPYINDLSAKSLKTQRAAQMANKQEEIHELRHQYTEHPFIVDGKSKELFDAKQKMMKDMHVIESLHESYKSSSLENAQTFLKEIEECKHIVQQHNAILDQAIARSVTEEACAAYKDELEAMKSQTGLSAEALERIVVENHVRDPYRRHTYLSTLDQHIDRCRQYHAPEPVTNSLESLRKQASRVLAPNIVLEMRDRESSERRAQEFDIKMASERSAKDYFDAAKKDLAQVNAAVDETRKQMDQFEKIVQRHMNENDRAMNSCASSAQNATAALVHVNNEQQRIREQMNQLAEIMRNQSAQTQADVHAIMSHLAARDFPATNPQQQGGQGYNGPSAPPFDE